MGYAEPRALLIRKAADYVSRILRMFGVMEDTGDLGFGVEGPEEQAARPYLDALAKLRDGVRSAAQKKQSAASAVADAVVVQRNSSQTQQNNTQTHTTNS